MYQALSTYMAETSSGCEPLLLSSPSKDPEKRAEKGFPSIRIQDHSSIDPSTALIHNGKETNGNDPLTNGHLDPPSSSDTPTLSEETSEPGTNSARTSRVNPPAPPTTTGEEEGEDGEKVDSWAVSTDLDLENGNMNLDSDHGVHI